MPKSRPPLSLVSRLGRARSRHRLVVEPRPPADDGSGVPERAITVQLDAIREHQLSRQSGLNGRFALPAPAPAARV